MNIIININNLLTAAMLEKYLLRHSLRAHVEQSGPLDPALPGMDAAIYFADNISAVPLIEFLQKAEGSSPFVKKLLFVKKEDAALFGAEITGQFDEVVCLPVNAAALVQKLALLCPHAAKAAMQANGEEILPPAPSPRQLPTDKAPVQPMAAGHSYTLDDLAQSGEFEDEDPYAGLAVPRPAAPAGVPGEDTETPAAADEPLADGPPASSEPVFDTQPAASTQPLSAPAAAQPAAEPDLPARQNAAAAAAKSSKAKTVRVKPCGLKRALSVAGKALTALMLLLVLFMALLVVGSRKNRESPSIFGYQYYVVYTGSMKGTNPDSFDAGSLIFVKKADPAKIRVGDIITFNRSGEDAKLTTHRVVNIAKDAKGKLIFTTKGDANAGPDDAAVPQSIVKGVVVGSVPKIGKFIVFAQTKAGMVYFVYVPAGAIVLYEIYVFAYDRSVRKKSKDEPVGGSG